MQGIRIALTVFILLLAAACVAGWFWTGSHQAPAQSAASRIVLTLSMAAGLAGLVTIWKHSQGIRR